MLNALTILFSCQLIGELGVVALGLPVPGPVMGMVLLLAGLIARGQWQRAMANEPTAATAAAAAPGAAPEATSLPPAPDNIAKVGDGLLGALSLLFVPAGVGVMLHAPLLARDGLAISVALVVSTLVTIAVTAWMMAALSRFAGAGTALDASQSQGASQDRDQRP